MRNNKMLPATPVHFRDTEYGSLDGITVVYSFAPLGLIWIQTGTKKQFNGKTDTEEIVPIGTDVVDPRFITADDFTPIEKNRCRVCHKYMKFYDRVYYQDIAAYGSRSLHRMDYGNNYCESCANQLAMKSVLWPADRRKEKTIIKSDGGTITYVASQTWNGDPVHDPDAVIIETR